MRKDQRDAMLTAFRTTSMPVLLVSLKSGSVGLNLTSASRVIMLDLWWNPAIEEQAIDRVHRIGMAFPGTQKSISEKLKDDTNQFLVCLSCVLFVSGLFVSGLFVSGLFVSGLFAPVFVVSLFVSLHRSLPLPLPYHRHN